MLLDPWELGDTGLSDFSVPSIYVQTKLRILSKEEKEMSRRNMLTEQANFAGKFLGKSCFRNETVWACSLSIQYPIQFSLSYW